MSRYIEYDEPTKILANVIVKLCREKKHDDTDAFQRCIYCGHITNNLKKMRHNDGCAVTMADNILMGRKYE